MRTLPAGIPITDTITRPVFLLTLAFPVAGTIRYTSRETVTISGTTYTAAGFTVQRYTSDERGSQAAEILFPLNAAVRTLLLTEDFRGKVARLYMVYGDGPWVSGDRVLLLDGWMDGAPDVSDNVRLSLVSEGLKTAFSPRWFARKPFFNHIPPPGKVYTWGGQTATVP